MIKPGFDYVAAQWGVWRAGGVVLPLPIRDPVAELIYQIDDSSTSILVVDTEYYETLNPIAKAREIRLEVISDLQNANQGRMPQIREARRAMMVYTSGTTSRPKGVVTTHTNIRAQINSLVKAWKWTNKDHILHTLPLHHVHGIINALACALWVGATCEILPKFDQDQTYHHLASGDITLYMAVPTVYKSLIRAWREYPLEKRIRISKAISNLRLMISGSDKLEQKTLEEWYEISNHVLLERYGMTEIGMALSNPLKGDRIPGTVGAPLPTVEVRVVESDQEIPLGEDKPDHDKIFTESLRGELQVRGPSVFKEYWRKPEMTTRAFTEDGWFSTGDIVEQNLGIYRILGRASQDFMISGGENINLREVETIISSHPDIETCSVVGVPDEYWGKAVSAALVPEAGKTLDTNELINWCKDKISPHKVPKNILVLDSLPRTSVGKVIKPEVVKLFLVKET